MEVKGTSVLAIKEFVEENFKKEYHVWLNALPERSQYIFNSEIDIAKWYPVYDAALVPMKAFCDLFYKGNYKKGAWESGRYSAGKALNSIYEPLMIATSTSYMIEKGTQVYASYYHPSELTIEEKGITDIDIYISGLTISEEVFDYRVAGWIEKAIEMVGGLYPKVKRTKSTAKGDDILEFKCSWT